MGAFKVFVLKYLTLSSLNHLPPNIYIYRHMHYIEFYIIGMLVDCIIYLFTSKLQKKNENYICLSYMSKVVFGYFLRQKRLETMKIKETCSLVPLVIKV